MTRAIRLCLWFVVLLSMATVGRAQAPPFPALSAAVDLEISGAGHRFFGMHAAASGLIAADDIGANLQSRIRVFSPSGTLVATLAAGQPSPLGSLERLGSYGWLGDSIWTFALGTLSLIELAPVPRVVKSRTVPRETPGPPGTSPQTPRIIPYPSVRAAYPDGGVLVAQTFPALQARIVLNRLDLDDREIPGFLVRTTAEHRYATFVPTSTAGGSEPCIRRAAVSGQFGPASYSLPLCRPPESAISPDGRFIVYSRAAVPITDPAVVRVTRMRISGDSVYARDYRIPTTAISKAEADSIRVDAMARARRLEATYPGATRLIDSILRTEMPSHRQPVRELVAGNDGVVLLEFLRTASERRYLALDPKGDPLGVFTLPLDVLVMEASRNALWGLRGQPPFDLVRYRIGP